ncbi:MAG: DUF86 domain-containing protein [Phycisphaerae bacterium]
MTINGVVQRKFALLDKHLLELQKHLEGVEAGEFKNNWVLRCMSERSLQVMTEIVIDIAERILALRGAGPAATACEALEKLVRLGAVQSADPYIPLVRFRNLIVHRYEEIDPEIVYNIAKNKLDLFRQFRHEVDRYEI